MSFSVQFSVQRLSNNGTVKEELKHPHAAVSNIETYNPLKDAKTNIVNGADPAGVSALRSGRTADGSEIVINKATAKEIVKALVDNGLKTKKQIAFIEMPVYYAAIWAAQDKNVRVTDETGHWRPLSATAAGALVLLNGLKGLKSQSGDAL